MVAGAPKSGIDSITGEGLKEAMAGAQVVIDLTNSPSCKDRDRAMLEFFETSGRNLLPAEAAAGVRYHVALSIVGTDRSWLFARQVRPGETERGLRIPYTIIHATQFMECRAGIAASSAVGNIIRLPPGLFQPIAADDVAPIVAEVALAAPRNGFRLRGDRRPGTSAVPRNCDPRPLVRDPKARYWGGRLEEDSLAPLGEARLGRIGLDAWLRRSQGGA